MPVQPRVHGDGYAAGGVNISRQNRARPSLGGRKGADSASGAKIQHAASTELVAVGGHETGLAPPARPHKGPEGLRKGEIAAVYDHQKARVRGSMTRVARGKQLEDGVCTKFGTKLWHPPESQSGHSSVMRCKERPKLLQRDTAVCWRIASSRAPLSWLLSLQKVRRGRNGALKKGANTVSQLRLSGTWWNPIIIF